MPCYKPLRPYLGRNGSITFNERDSIGVRTSLPCGKCIGCRLDHSKEWAVRCMHEAQLWEHNHFVTLTYSPENLPHPPSLDKTHFQKFMKRLRKRKNGKIRYFHCGEYGEKLGRPHYHALLFNLRLDDLVPFKVFNGTQYYRSAELENVWQKGFVTVGSVTFQSAAYVARYIMKKQGGQNAIEHYFSPPDEMGETHPIDPEYATMSLKPAIGTGWYERFGNTDCHAQDFVVADGKRIKPPRHYDRLLKARDPERYEEIKARRLDNMDKDRSPERLAVREKVKTAQIGALKRGYENGKT